jgi:type VI secretion system secreted protein VgrG
MNKKSGTAGSLVAPIDPKAPHEADVADPGALAAIKAEQIAQKVGKFGEQKFKPFKPAVEKDSPADEGKQEKETEKKLSWIEIELVGEDKKPIPGERYRVTLPDQTVDEGTLDDKGHARIEGFEKGDCKITFPDLDEEAWEDA